MASELRASRSAAPEAVRVVAPSLPPSLRAALHEQVLAVQNKSIREFTAALRSMGEDIADDRLSITVRAICLLVADLIEQGWKLTIERDHFTFEPPFLHTFADEGVGEVKARIRRSLRLARDRQLQETSVRQFIRRMERRNFRPNGRFSVLDLVDRGDDLAKALSEVARLPEAEREAGLAALIEPVVEICDPQSRCAHTGLRLLDIWRYFRHTWTLEYRPIPGRQMPILIRNAARPNAPVIGIAMLASPALRMRSRDGWIGWRLDILEESIASGEWQADEVAQTLDRHISVAIGEIRADDLATPEELANPTERIIFRLGQRAAGAAEERLAKLREHYEAGTQGEAGPTSPKRHDPSLDWRLASEDLLYIRKRAENLSKLLEARSAFNDAGLLARPVAALEELLRSKRGRRALEIAITEVRKAGLASRVADVSVCGAIAPYNELLGGKLVTLLITSQEVRDFYRQRYGEQVSLIASQLAGFPVTRSAELQVLTTTSLYGIGSSQYNRLKLRAAEHEGLGSDIVWHKLGVTEGYGTAHLSSSTVQVLRALSAEAYGARRVNNVFGEGSSPRLRQIREGLDALGVNSDDILHHGTPRIIYACELVKDARRYLMGFERGDPPEAPSVATIAAAWRRRWLLGRIGQPEVIYRLAEAGPMSVRAELWADEEGQFVLGLDNPLPAESD